MTSLRTEWAWEYILASYIVAVLGSATSLQVMKQRTGAKGVLNWAYLIGGAIALGAVGIWCMHFVGMMALTLYDGDRVIEVGFNPGMTAGSLFISIVIIAAGFWIAGDPHSQKLWKHVLGGVAGGLGVSVMHYLGMMAMVMQADVQWDAGIIAASVCVGVFAATAALLIFFRYERLWHSDIRVLLAASCVMGVAVCGMHYTGMQAASWTLKSDGVDLSSYASRSTLTAIIIPMAVCTCLLLLVLIFIKYRRLLRTETIKAQQLILSAVVVDSKGRVLSTIAGTLPSVVIEKQYMGVGTFDRNNADFLRMLKTSFAWQSMKSYLVHLRKLRTDRSISHYSLDLYEKFMSAVKEMSELLHVPINNLGILYWSPTNSMISLIVKSTNLSSSHLDTVNLRFAERAKISEQMSEFLPKLLDPSEWVDSLTEYVKKCTMPIAGELSSEKLNEMLRHVCEDLFVDKELMENEIQEWRTELGRFVKTRPHLQSIVSNRDQWKQIKLNPMVKVQIENTFIKQNANSSITEDAESTLYIGLYYVQVSSSGLQVMIQQSGPYSMIPMVRFGRDQSISSTQLSWLKKLSKHETAREMELCNASCQPFFEALADKDDADPSLVLFQRDFWTGVTALSKLLGTSKDLTASNLWNSGVLQITTDICVLPFVICNMTSSFPLDYSIANFHFIPLIMFEIMHFSLYSAKSSSHWTRRLVKGQIMSDDSSGDRLFVTQMTTAAHTRSVELSRNEELISLPHQVPKRVRLRTSSISHQPGVVLDSHLITPVRPAIEVATEARVDILADDRDVDTVVDMNIVQSPISDLTRYNSGETLNRQSSGAFARMVSSEEKYMR